MQYFGTLILSLFVTLALVPVFRSLALRCHAVDMPNERKVHVQPMAKTGGLAMALGALLPLVFWVPQEPLVLPLFVSASIIVLFGFLDDLRDLPPRYKLTAQMAAALIVVVVGHVRIYSLGSLAPEGFLLPDPVAIPLTVFVIVGVTNAINLADGLDGLAGGVSLLTFVGLALMAFLMGRTALTLVAVAVCGAIFGFLRFNTYPATVFMGDAGSQLLGFLGVVLALCLTQESLYSPLVALLVIGFPIIDTLRVMLERKSRGKPLFSPDKNHFHHKLLALGLRHSESVLVIYVLQTTLVILAFLLRFFSDWLLLAGYFIFSALVMTSLHLAERYHWYLSANGLWARGMRGVLRPLKSHLVLMRIVFPAMQLCIAMALIMLFASAGAVPVWMGGMCLALGAALLTVHFLYPAWLGMVLRLCIFPATPFLVYQVDVACTFSRPFIMGFFGVLVVLTILVIRYTRRQGYNGTPLDYLVLFVALAVPNLAIAGSSSSDVMIGVAAKTVALFFAMEVCLVEMRGKFARLEWLVVGMFFAVGVRALIQ